MFPLLLSTDRRFWRAKCTFGDRLSQWLKVSLREAPVGQRDDDHEPDHDPEVVPDRQRDLRKEWVSGTCPAGQPGCGDDLRGLQVEDRPVPEPVGRDQVPACGADTLDGAVVKRVAD